MSRKVERADWKMNFQTRSKVPKITKIKVRLRFALGNRKYPCVL